MREAPARLIAMMVECHICQYPLERTAARPFYTCIKCKMERRRKANFKGKDGFIQVKAFQGKMDKQKFLTYAKSRLRGS